MRIQFINIGKSLGPRVTAQRIRAEVEHAFNEDQFVTFDFEGVKIISHSFADECFGKLFLKWDIEKLKSKSTFINTNKLIKRTIAYSINERISSIGIE